MLTARGSLPKSRRGSSFGTSNKGSAIVSAAGVGEMSPVFSTQNLQGFEEDFVFNGKCLVVVCMSNDLVFDYNQ